VNQEVFDELLEDQINRIRSVLATKAKEYSTEDKLHNFKEAAVFGKSTMRHALAGMMMKHTVSLYDMCNSSNFSDLDTWDEKITDHINYLILLKAVVLEEYLTPTETTP
jgi:hypothetical protein